MISTKKVRVTVTREEVTALVCNQCGIRCPTSEETNSQFLHVDQTWGFFSAFDGEVHSFDLCQACYKKLVKSFKHPARTSNYL